MVVGRRGCGSRGCGLRVVGRGGYKDIDKKSFLQNYNVKIMYIQE